jgi:hypothetical protein
MRYRHRLSSITALVAAACVAAPLSAQGRAAAPKPNYSAPDGAPYTAEEVTVTTPMGHTGNYAKLPPPVRVDPNVVGFVTDWLVRRLK